MKKLKAVSSMVDLLQHNPSPDNNENYPKFIKMPSFYLIDSDEKAKEIIQKAFAHLGCRANERCAPEYYMIVSMIFDDDDYKPAEVYSPKTKDVAGEIYSYFFENNAFAGNVSALRADIFKSGLVLPDTFCKEHYVDTVIFYNCLR